MCDHHQISSQEDKQAHCVLNNPGYDIMSSCNSTSNKVIPNVDTDCIWHEFYHMKCEAHIWTKGCLACLYDIKLEFLWTGVLCCVSEWGAGGCEYQQQYSTLLVEWKTEYQQCGTYLFHWYRWLNPIYHLIIHDRWRPEEMQKNAHLCSDVAFVFWTQCWHDYPDNPISLLINII